MTGGANKIGFGSNNAFQLRFRVHVQADSRWFLNDQADGDRRNEFLMRRIRAKQRHSFDLKFGIRGAFEFVGG